MGYTHYWQRPEKLDEKRFKAALHDCKKVCKALAVKIRIVKEYDNSISPIFNKNLVRFNGKGDNGHETFYIPVFLKKPDYQRKFSQPKNEVFAFCKTAYKPYDLNVTACLIVFKHHFGECFLISSDGESTDWDKAREVCQKILGWGKDFILRREDETEE